MTTLKKIDTLLKDAGYDLMDKERTAKNSNGVIYIYRKGEHDIIIRSINHNDGL